MNTFHTPGTVHSINDIGAYEAEQIDLAVSWMSDSPDPVQAGDQLFYAIDVRNMGLSTSTGLELTDTLPPGITLNSVSENRGGSCLQTSGVVRCQLDTLKPGFVWTVYLNTTVEPTTTGTLNNTAQILAAAYDRFPANNSETESTAVTQPLQVRLSADT